MTTRGHLRAKATRADTADKDDDDLTRLVRLIARQAAQEAFKVFRDEFRSSLAPDHPAGDPREPIESSSDGCTGAPPGLDPAERLLSVTEIAHRLSVSTKTVRRMIERGELPVQRLGKLLRIREGAMSACLAKAVHK